MPLLDTAEKDQADTLENASAEARFAAAQRAYQVRSKATTPTAGDEPSIALDSDLAEQFANIKGVGALARLLRKQIEQRQTERNEKRARHAAMTPTARRRDRVRQEIAEARNVSDRQHIHHIHSVLALCGFPYRRPSDDQQDFIREYGNNSLVVQAGYLKDPATGKMVRQGLPYGPKARLMMLHVCSMALHQNSATIEVADSMSAFIRELGYQVQGGPRGTIAQFKEQLHRLSAARMTIGLWDANSSSKTIHTQPIRAFDIWLPSDPDQKTLWNSTLQLDQEFFQSLKQHALPVDIRALRALANSAKQMDMVLWFGYRLRNLQRPYMISWRALQDQFGSEIKRHRKFQESFADDLKVIKEVFPKLSATLTEEGLKLFPADAEALLLPVRKRNALN
jgi:hypothetical protein